MHLLDREPAVTERATQHPATLRTEVDGQEHGHRKSLASIPAGMLSPVDHRIMPPLTAAAYASTAGVLDPPLTPQAGRNQSWLAPPVQSQIVTWVPHEVDQPGTSRQRPDCGLRSEPSRLWYPLPALRPSLQSHRLDEGAVGGAVAGDVEAWNAQRAHDGDPSLSISIEVPPKRDALQRAGCDLGQGYHFARPVDPAAAESPLFSDQCRVAEAGLRVQ